MKGQALPPLAALAFMVWMCGNSALASPAPQNKERTKLDADINAIGNRRIARGVNFYSVQHEKELGKSLADEIERSSKLVEDPAVIEYIQRVAQNVANHSDAGMPITVRVVDNDAVDAFTLAGGYQYVSRGLLLRLESEAELASVLARGIAHTALRSATTQATKSQLIAASTVPVLASGPRSSSNSQTLTVSLIELKMKTDDELDADYFGIQYVYKAGYDPECFTNFLQRIWDSNATSATDDVSKVFGTYPPLDERLAALRKEISKILPSRDGAIVSTPEFDAFKGHLRAQKPEGLDQPQKGTQPTHTYLDPIG
jgi:predicted Zn-dependent protease